MASNRSLDLISPAFLNFLAGTYSIDRIAKALQYGPRFLSWFVLRENDKQRVELSTRLLNFSNGIAMSRKTFRFGREFQEFQKLYKALYDPPTATRFLTILRHLFMSGYWMFDHIVWLMRLGLIRGQDAKFSRISLTSWAIALFFSAVIDIIGLSQLSERMRRERKVATHRQLEEMKAKRTALYIDLLKNVLDELVALGLAKHVELNNGVIGAAGFIAAVLSGYQMWPSS